MTPARIAGLIHREAVKAALDYMKHGPARPEPKNNMDRWLMGRKG